MTVSPNRIRPAGISVSELRARMPLSLVRMLASLAEAKATNQFPEQILKGRWPDDGDAGLIFKANTSPASTTGWGGNLAATAYLAQIVSLAPQSAAAALIGMATKLDFGRSAAIKLPGLISTGGKSSFVVEGASIPARQLSFLSGPLLTPKALKTLVVLTREIFEHSTPSIEALVRMALNDSMVIDLEALLDDTAGDASRPPGLRYGIAGLVANTSPVPVDAMIADIATVVNSVASVSGNSLPVLIASTAQATLMRSWAQRVPYTILSSKALTGTLIAVAPSGLVSVFSDTPKFSVSTEATVQLSDTPGEFGTAAETSLFQTDCLSMRLISEMSWGLRSPQALAWLAPTAW